MDPACADKELMKKSSAQTPSNNKNSKSTTGSLSILLVDDSDLSRLLIRLMLEKIGHTVSLSSSGEDAIVESRKRNYDLILMDCNMPGMSGDECIRLLKQEGKLTGHNSKVVAITSDNSEEMIARCQKVGVDGFLPKPFDLPDLTAYLNEAFAKSA